MSDPEIYITKLTAQEKQWIRDKRIKRLTDNQETLIYPMGAERYLSLELLGKTEERYAIHLDIKDKNILVIPGYGTSSFLFAQAGAKSVTVYDKDPVTIAWMKAFKKYYHYREFAKSGAPYPSIAELMDALTCWYPPLIQLPHNTIINSIFWALKPRSLRRAYIFYMVTLVQNAIKSNSKASFELNNNITFHTGEANQLLKHNKSAHFDTAYVPYLLGVSNGIETTKEIVEFIKLMLKVVPTGRIIITPARSKKEFHFVGQNYFNTTGYPSINSIPELSDYFISEDKHWFKTQGLAVFGNKPYVGLVVDPTTG